MQYTAQFNRGGYVNVLFGQSYQLFGANSFAVGDTTNTGLGSGLDTTRSDYVARVSYQPDRTYTFTTRFRFDEDDFTLQRFELEADREFRPLDHLADVRQLCRPAAARVPGPARRHSRQRPAQAQPQLGAAGRGALRHRADKFNQTQIGIGYIDDCLIFALNYITDYAYSGSVSVNHTVSCCR